MLNSKNVAATIAVKKLREARGFYEGKLRLSATETDGSNYIAYKSGASSLLVYESKFAGGCKATVATWDVGEEIESIVQTLKASGVPFPEFDMPGTQRVGDIYVSDEMKVAWCSDPDGNILCLVSGKG